MSCVALDPRSVGVASGRLRALAAERVTIVTFLSGGPTAGRHGTRPLSRQRIEKVTRTPKSPAGVGQAIPKCSYAVDGTGLVFIHRLNPSMRRVAHLPLSGSGVLPSARAYGSSQGPQRPSPSARRRPFFENRSEFQKMTRANGSNRCPRRTIRTAQVRIIALFARHP